MIILSLMEYNKELLDQINSIGSQPCTQPVFKQLVSLRQLKNRNFLTSQSSRNFMAPEIKPRKVKKQETNIFDIRFKFQIKEEDVHNVLQKIVRVNQKSHLQPINLPFETDHSIRGLSVGAVSSQVPATLTRRITCEESKRTRQRHSSEPEEDILRQLNLARTTHVPPRNEQEKVRPQNVMLGRTRNFNASPANPTCEIEVLPVNEPTTPKGSHRDPKATQTQRRYTRKQMNIYKKRFFEEKTLANFFKQKRQQELDEIKRYEREQRRMIEKTHFEWM